MITLARDTPGHHAQYDPDFDCGRSEHNQYNQGKYIQCCHSISPKLTTRHPLYLMVLTPRIAMPTETIPATVRRFRSVDNFERTAQKNSESVSRALSRKITEKASPDRIRFIRGTITSKAYRAADDEVNSQPHVHMLFAIQYICCCGSRAYSPWEDTRFYIRLSSYLVGYNETKINISSPYLLGINLDVQDDLNMNGDTRLAALTATSASRASIHSVSVTMNSSIAAARLRAGK
jgi:hypothetical protein